MRQGPDGSPQTLPLALFLLAQTEYWYLGISSGWMDKDWSWYPEYDRFYGKPLGRAAQTTNPPGWKRGAQLAAVLGGGNQ